jgi:hypothetical protein
MFHSVINLIFFLLVIFIIMFIGSTYKLFSFLLIPLEWINKGGGCLYFVIIL